MTPSDMEAAVERDMRAQQEWVRALQPQAALLKFRLPWTAGNTNYLDGTVLLPVWGPATTTESRLLVVRSSVGGTCFPGRLWNNESYMEQMCYFNTQTRVSSYTHALVGAVRGLCSCYDCAAEVAIWSSYLRICGTAHVPKSELATLLANNSQCGGIYRCSSCLKALVSHLVQAASEHCSPHGQRHLDTQPKHPAARQHSWYVPKVFDSEGGHVLYVGGVKRPRGARPPAD